MARLIESVCCLFLVVSSNADYALFLTAKAMTVCRLFPIALEPGDQIHIIESERGLGT